MTDNPDLWVRDDVETLEFDPAVGCPDNDRQVSGCIQEMLDALGRSAALVDRDGTIRWVNCHWSRTVAHHAANGLLVGDSYTDFLRQTIDRGDHGLVPILRAVEQISGGTRWRFSSVYKGSDVFAGYYYKVTASRIYLDREQFAFVTAQDVTALFEDPRPYEADFLFRS